MQQNMTIKPGQDQDQDQAKTCKEYSAKERGPKLCWPASSKCRQLKLKPTVLASLTLLQNYVIYFRRQDELRMEDEDDNAGHEINVR